MSVENNWRDFTAEYSGAYARLQSMKLPGTPSQVLSLIRHAGAGRHPGGAGMDTGFRRYDENFVRSRSPDPTRRCIFEGTLRPPLAAPACGGG